VTVWRYLATLVASFCCTFGAGDLAIDRLQVSFWDEGRAEIARAVEWGCSLTLVEAGFVSWKISIVDQVSEHIGVICPLTASQRYEADIVLRHLELLLKTWVTDGRLAFPAGPTEGAPGRASVNSVAADAAVDTFERYLGRL
jgi:hypothetical protein